MKKNNKEDYIFRRVRGRIVPIKKKKNSGLSKREKSGLAVAATGVGIGVAGGVAASVGIRQSKALARVARINKIRGKHLFKQAHIGQMVLGESSKGASKNRLLKGFNAAKMYSSSKKLGQRAARLRKFSFGLGSGVTLATSALLLAGIDPILDKRTPGKESTSKDIVKGFAEQGVATAIMAGIAVGSGRSRIAKRAIKLISKRKHRKL